MREEEEAFSDCESYVFKIELAEMLIGGVIIDVTTPEEAKIAEMAGAVAVTVSEKGSLDITTGAVARMAHPETIQQIQEAIAIPIIAKCRIGHFAEAQILESLFVDFIDESEILTPADNEHYIDKNNFRIPFICGAKNLGDALRHIAEGAAMIRTEGAVGSGNIADAVRHIRLIKNELKRVHRMDHAELMSEATRLQAPHEMLQMVAEHGKLPVPLFAAGGIVTPADAALMVQLGAESVFVDTEIFSSEDPLECAEAIVGAVTYHRDPEILTKVSLGHVKEVKESEHLFKKDEILANRGW